jgi:RNA polymerase sigma factor (sigma-70 family)
MRSYVQGDARGFDGLFARLAPAVHGFFLRSFGSAAVADDLLQLTFLKLHRSRADYNPELPLRPWLFTIASRVRLDELRRRYRVSDSDGEEEMARLAEEREATASNAEQDLARSDQQRAVLAALEKLPESQRVVIQLHRFEGMKFAEIAEVLGTTAMAVKLRAFRGYEQLREELRPLYEEGLS